MPKKKLLILLMPILLIGCTKNPSGPLGGQWTQATAHAPFSGRYGLSGTVFNNQMWVLGGASGSADNSVTYYYSDAWSSTNGASWSQGTGSGPYGGRYGSQLLSFNGNLWLIGGNSGGALKNDVWKSPDGTNWTQVLSASVTGGPTQFSPREDFGAVVFNNLMWVIGGWASRNKNDVWSSPDGVTWTQVVATAPFGTRWGMSVLVHQNSIWLMSGATSTSANTDPTFAYNDVWSSPDGSTWTQVSTGTINRYYYDQVVSTGSLLFLTYGFLWNNWGPQAGSASTSDGVNWTFGTTAYSARFGHRSIFYDNKIWVIAGCDDSCSTAPCPKAVSYLNDVWYTQ